MDTKLIALLNEDLAREYAAAIQYYQHAAVINGIYSAFAGELEAHAGEEIGHAKKLNDRINYLRGIPGTAVAPVYTASDSVKMLVQDLTGEDEAIARYKERIKQVRAAGDYGTEEILLGILADEEDHANFLETILGK